MPDCGVDPGQGGEKPSFVLTRVLEPEFIEATNGRAVEFIGNYPLMLSLVEAFIGVSAQSQIDK